MVDLKTLDWAVVELSEQDNHVVYIPSGFAHGFLSKSDGATVVYALSSPYDPANDHSLYAFDPEIGIGWGVPAGRVIMSERDEAALTVREARRKKLIP
jgi:dTDP-4-dehydrorhamnose 3,5-epimerase